jgi:hypothetical protein
MLNQIFKTQVQIQILFGLLEQVCIKTEKYYLVDMNAYRKLVYHNLYEVFSKQILDNYHLSKQFYLTRKLTYNSFTNIIRQICKSNNIMFTNQIKYNESKYNIDYMIYMQNIPE